MPAQLTRPPGKLVLDARKKLTLTGATEVVSFDELAVVVKTPMGTLVIQGKDLQLKQLTPDGGQVAVEGTVTSLHYEEPRQTAGWAKRLFG